MNERKYVGTFDTDGEIRVSDPAYDEYAGLNLTMTVDVKPGRWMAWVEISDESGWGKRVSHLMAAHQDRSVSVYDPWGETIHDDIGVDSGQCGFFDLAHYRRDEDAAGYSWPQGEASKWLREMAETDPWYAMCCAETTIRRAGVVPGGAVSSSGYGDGTYLLFAQYNDMTGAIDALLLEFISPEENEDDEDDWDDDGEHDEDPFDDVACTDDKEAMSE